MSGVFIVPEPKKLFFSGKMLVFDGFIEFPEFLAHEFNVPEGRWKISRTTHKGTGVRVKEGEIAIWGEETLCYATILQIMRQYEGYLPEIEATEVLNFGFRGYHLDIARGGVPTVATFKRILRWLFLLKYNYFAIYFEDLFPWKKYPQIGRHRGRLTDDELKEIVTYGKNLGIEVFPSLELSGHMENILSLPEFQNFSEWHKPSEGCLDLSNREATEFAYDLLREAVESSTKYVHIGGDETWALGRGKSLNKNWKFEGPVLYELHHRNMVEIVKKAGKNPILWGDMISGMYLSGDATKWTEAIESPIWKEVLVANWDYDARSLQHFKDKIKIFQDRGIQQIAAPGLSNWNKYYPNFKTALENLKNFLIAARETNLQGFMVTAWGDDGEECLFSLLDPLILAAMEFAEGGANWQEKWIAITCEDESVLRARILFGDPSVSELLKHVVFKDFWFNRLTPENKEETKSHWEKILKETETAHLPRDLDFIRRLLETGVKILNNEAKVSDFIVLSNLYSNLWLEERKPEGLVTILQRLWGAAGREDMNVSV
jgi:hexosaminidase